MCISLVQLLQQSMTQLKTKCSFAAQKAEACNPSSSRVVPLCLQGRTTLALPSFWWSAGNTWSSFDCSFRTESLPLYHVVFSAHGSMSLSPFIFRNTLIILDLGPCPTVVTIQQQCTSFQIESLYRVLRIGLEHPFVGRKKSATHQVFLHVHSLYLNELFTKTWGVDTLEVKAFLPSSGCLVQLQILRTLQGGDKGKSYKAARNEARPKPQKMWQSKWEESQ